jgi:hypothetical protein
MLFMFIAFLVFVRNSEYGERRENFWALIMNVIVPVSLLLQNGKCFSRGFYVRDA